MKRLLLILLPVMLVFPVIPQDTGLPSVTVTDLNGVPVDFSQLHNDGNPVILSFWATWCTPCLREMNAIAEVYEQWQEETGVLFIAVSIDDSRTRSRVLPLINSNYWDYDFFLDPNHDLKRAMNVNLIPHTFLLNGDMEVVWQHTSYSEGMEVKMYEMIRKLSAGESLDED